MSQKKKKPVALLFAPHPDDVEAFSGQVCLQTIQRGWEVHEALSNGGEYGTTDDNFKGKRIRKIRYNELTEASKVYGVDENGDPLMHIHWMEYIDGFVPYNQESIARIKKFIEKIKPDLIIGPDPFVYFDGHSDHLNLGKSYYEALKSMAPEKRPKLMLFFQSLMPDVFVTMKDKKTVTNAALQHRSQWDKFTIKIFHNAIPLLYLARKLRFGIGKQAVGFRRVTFNPEDHKPKGLAKLIFRLFEGKEIGTEESRYNPLPDALGLELEPNGDIQ